jgi:hypothetical protein
VFDEYCTNDAASSALIETFMLIQHYTLGIMFLIATVYCLYLFQTDIMETVSAAFVETISQTTPVGTPLPTPLSQIMEPIEFLFGGEAWT